MPMNLPSDQHEEASYIIFKKNGDIFARNGDSGNIEFSGTDAATVIQNAIDALGANGGVIASKIEQELEISSTLDPCDNLILQSLRLKAEDELNDNIIESSAKRTNVTIKDCIFDGNKANQTFTGTRTDHTLVRFPNGDENIRILNNELRDGLAGAGICLSGLPINPHVEGNFVHDMGTSTESCDGIICFSTRGYIAGNRIKNVSDTPIANDNGQKQNIVNNVIWNTDSWNTNVSQASNGITPYAPSRDWEGRIEGNIIVNLGSNASGIDSVESGSYNVKAQIIGNYLIGDLYHGIEIRSDGAQCEISNNYVNSPSVRGINFLGVDSIISGNVVWSAGDRSIGIVGDRNVIAGNKVNSGALSGIFAGPNVSDLTITNNIVSNKVENGIYLYDSNTDCVITGNRCQGNGNYGILEGTGGDYNIINANNCRGNTTGGISTVGANSVVTDNLP